MKTDSILIRMLGALGACVLAVAPSGAAAAAVQAPLVAALPKKCADGKYEGKVLQVQQDLKHIYAADARFMTDAGKGVLADGKLGVVTRKWLGLFCEEHPFKVPARSFDASVAAELSRFRIAMDSAAAVVPEAETGPLEATYRYDPKALRKPKDLELVLARLRTLTDLYADKDLFADAVKRALKGLPVDAVTLARIEHFSAVDGYMLPSQKLSQLKGASPALVEKLMLKTDIDYASADDFHMELEIAIAEGGEKAELAGYAAQIDRLARVTHYRIPSTIAADLAGAAELEPPLAALYRGLENIEYPSRHLLKLALRARAEWALGMCPANSNGKEQRLEGDDFTALLNLLPGPQAAAMTSEVNNLRNTRDRCRNADLLKAQRLTNAVHDALFDRLDNAAELVKLATTPADQSGPGAIDGCGCAHDAREGLTYGFYPLWTDGSKKELDFDVLSRIGLYGMTINDKGELKYPAGVSVMPWTLLEAAHRHMTKVDWVLYKSDWNRTGEGMDDLFERLEQSIDGHLDTAPPNTDWRGTALATFGLERGPTAGDGITLRFEGFPSAPRARQALNAFVAKLYTKLRGMKPARQLNIMVTQAEMAGAEQAAFSTPNLLALMQLTNYIGDTEDPANSRRLREHDLRVLVMLQEPTSGQKLLLRADIENGLHGSDRMRMLRNAIPVLEYDGAHAMQLKDDIIYFQDNFGGIGFWPLPFAGGKDNTADSTTANHVLHEFFTHAGLDGGVLSEVIDLICPNRTWLRWLAWISAILAIVAGITLARCRGCGTRLDNNALYMAGMVALIVLPFMVIAALVVGDPLFKSDSGVHWLIAALLVVVVIVPGVYGLLKPARKLP